MLALMLALMVAFLALHDISAAAGPTFFAPGTHDVSFQAKVENMWRPVGGNAAARAV